MDCAQSTEDKEGKARNEEIETQLKKDKMSQRNEIKMLLLGKAAPRILLSHISADQSLQELENQANRPF